MLRQRLISGLVLAATIIGLMIWDAHLSAQTPPHWPVTISGLQIDLGPWLFQGAICTATVFLFSALTTGELLKLARLQGYAPFGGLTRLFSAGLVIGPYIAFHLRHPNAKPDESWALPWIAAAVVLAFLLQMRRRRTEGALVDLATTLFIILYAGGLAGFSIKLRLDIGGPAGMYLLLLSLLVVKMTDTGAYFIGSLIGRHKFIEWLSPKKTWEGFGGGVLAAVLASLALGGYLHHAGLVSLDRGTWTWPWVLAAFGLTMSLCSVVGDLCGSLLKRDAAVKDSGQVIPGMGGILDVFDSPLFTAPMAWFFWSRLFGV